MLDDTPDARRSIALAIAEGLAAFAALAVVEGQLGAWIGAVFAAGAAAAIASRASSALRGSLMYAALVLGALAALQAARSLSSSWLPAGPIVMGTLVARALDQRRPGLLPGPIATLTQLFGVWVASDLT